MLSNKKEVGGSGLRLQSLSFRDRLDRVRHEHGVDCNACNGGPSSNVYSREARDDGAHRADLQAIEGMGDVKSTG